MLNEEENSTDQETGEMIYERKSLQVSSGQEPVRIDKWMQTQLQKTSRNKIQQAIQDGFLTVNTEKVKSNYKVRPGDKIVLMSFTQPASLEVKPENIPLNIIYEDDDLMVVNKPSNMVVHPGFGNYTGTLLNGIAFYLLQQNPSLDEDILPRYGLVHRIDKNTTGLLVLAKKGEAAAHLAKQFFDHTIRRNYVALAWGDLKNDSDTISTKIARHQRFRKIFDAYPLEEDIGKIAITHYKVLERFHYVTLVQCTLETGRTHQIRVHFKHIGHTLFNDVEYGGDKILKGTIYTRYKQFVENCFEVCPRCALHAKTLGFIHPSTQKEMFFEAPVPPDMQGLIDKWKNYTQ
ncbi:MAG: RluA family pseudouridine synthase [Bacteroidetes bacterium]|nr:RluA family pseudouridine synthase [Bacteroidota bacterium]